MARWADEELVRKGRHKGNLAQKEFWGCVSGEGRGRSGALLKKSGPPVKKNASPRSPPDPPRHVSSILKNKGEKNQNLERDRIRGSWGQFLSRHKPEGRNESLRAYGQKIDQHTYSKELEEGGRKVGTFLRRLRASHF